MTHHMLPAIGRDWMRACRHAFLIRHPARVLASYAAKREAVEFGDIGFAEQDGAVRRSGRISGQAPPVSTPTCSSPIRRACCRAYARRSAFPSARGC